MSGFRIESYDGRVQLGHIFRARLWSSRLDMHTVTALA